MSTDDFRDITKKVPAVAGRSIGLLGGRVRSEKD